MLLELSTFLIYLRNERKTYRNECKQRWICIWNILRLFKWFILNWTDKRIIWDWTLRSHYLSYCILAINDVRACVVFLLIPWEKIVLDRQQQHQNLDYDIPRCFPRLCKKIIEDFLRHFLKLQIYYHYHTLNKHLKM